jgi:hypothetical protein
VLRRFCWFCNTEPPTVTTLPAFSLWGLKAESWPTFHEQSPNFYHTHESSLRKTMKHQSV